MNSENIELFCSEYMQEKFKKYTNIDYKKRELKVEYIENGVICPIEVPENGHLEIDNYGGVLYEDLSFCELSRPKRFEGDSHVKEPKWYIGAREDLKPQDIEYIDEEVFFIGPLKKSIGHFMIEMFSFAWFLLNPENLKKYKVVYLLNGSEEPDWDIINTFYGGIGIDLENNFITVNKPTRFKKVVVAEQAMELQGKYHPVIKELFDKVKENIKPAPYKKIYFS
ncbi:hypothetical protein IJ531_00680, partial [bacterium]|nr:hypothetical protein [bacterium]